MMNRFFEKMVKSTMALLLVFTSLTLVEPVQAAKMTYELYPTPHLINYLDTDTTVTQDINVVYEKGIDDDTKARLVETFKQKNINVVVGQEIDQTKTNVLVGIKGSNGVADKYAYEHYQLTTTDLFNKTDANLLHVEGNVITVLGKDTDSAFYALTSLYHVVNQMPDMVMRNFHMEDYADIVSRGFIEGYYGNPWSTEDRVNLMKWSGYYKLNSYFYAPKDDPKHRVNWRDLYTPEEIKTKIEPLAKAGNESKCRFVYALHPFSHSGHLNFGDTYAKDLADLKAKYKQVIDAGVRQIALLADDFWNPGGPNGVRILKDLTEWLENEVKKEYPDMKTIIPYVPHDYMGNGSGAELQELRKTSDNIQIVMTGGKVWGEVSKNFTDTFTRNVGRGPYLWINWPCTDNSKKHLIMGGYSDFLHTNVNANNVQGIILNPMQQSEPSKVAIFGNACYSWNIWETEQEANQAWMNAFDYVDHNSAKDTDAASALRELSKHMINQNMDGRVRALQESVELKTKLNPIKEKMMKGNLSKEDLPAIEELINEFTVLQTAAKTYREQAGNKETQKQIIYWLNCWDDTTVAAIKYLTAIKASINGDRDTLLNELFSAQEAFAKSKTYNFLYVDHQEYAEVGVQHIVPFIKAMDTYASNKLEAAVNPNFVAENYITNREDSISVGETKHVFDGRDDTGITYQSNAHNMIKKDQYVGVSFSKVIDVNKIRILQGSGKNHYEHSKLQYTLDGTNWQDIQLVDMQNNFTATQNQPLLVEVNKANLPADFKAMGIRLIATENNRLDAWLEVKEIAINKEQNTDVKYTMIKKPSMNIHQGNAGNLTDGNDRTFVWFKPNAAIGDYVGHDLGSVMPLESIRAVIGTGDADKYTKYTIETSVDGTNYTAVPGFENGHTGSNSGQDKHEINLNGRMARYVRIRNLQNKGNWVKIAELTVKKADYECNLMRTNRWTVAQGDERNLYDGNDGSWVWYNPNQQDTFQVDDYIGYDFGKVIPLKSTHIIIGQTDPNKANKKGDKIVKYAIETSIDGNKWTAVDGYANYTGSTTEADVLNIELNNTPARYIRVRVLESRNTWGFFSEFTVQKGEGDTKPVINNTDAPITAIVGEDGMSLGNYEITLNTDQYVGMTFEHIYDTELVNPNIVRTLKDKGLVVEYSENGIEWLRYEKHTIAGHIRVRSEKDGATFNTSDLAVKFKLIGDFAVKYEGPNNDKGRDMRTANNVSKIFDNNLSTFASIADVQRTDKPITFDLGQSRIINDIRYYVNENSMDFLRHAKFEVSENGTGDWQEVLVVGKAGQPNTGNSDVAKNQDYFTHDTKNPGNMYAENTNLRVKGRYLRVTILSNYSHRWMDFGEIQINGGEYVSPNDAYDVTSSTVEEPHYYPLNAIDGDYTTSFKPTLGDDNTAKITYRIKNADAKYKQIRIIQKGKISNARVAVRHAGQRFEEYVGDLDQYITDLPFFGTAVEINITSKDVAPEILEFILITEPSNVTEKPVDKFYLGNAIDAEQYYAEADYTKASWKAYQDTLAEARKVYADPKATQELVDTTTTKLEQAMRDLVMNDQISFDKTELESLIKEAEAKNKADYTTDSWAVLEKTLGQAKDVFVKENATCGEVETATNLLKQALTGLTEKEPVNKQPLQQLVNDYSKLNQNDYTTDSWALFAEALENANKVLADVDATQNQVDDAKKLLEAAMAGLKEIEATSTDKSELEALIKEALNVNKDLYTKESYEALQEAIKIANAVVGNADADEKQVKLALDALQNALDSLVKVDSNGVATGDHTNVLVIVGTMVITGMTLAYIYSKKKRLNH